jgi:hypothetical protein
MALLPPFAPIAAVGFRYFYQGEMEAVFLVAVLEVAGVAR